MENENFTPEEIVELMQQNGFPDMSLDIFSQDVTDGLILNEDGTVNIFTYIAWIWKEAGNANHS